MEETKTSGLRRKFYFTRPRPFQNIYVDFPKMNWKDKDTYKKYVIHFFVIVVFILSLVFVIMAWYYHNESETAIASSQKIFFNPRDRVLTLSDPQGHDVIHAKLGQEIPSWQLPLNCPIVETGDQSKKECKWKKHAVLRIRHFKSVDRQIQCYNVSWQSLNHRYVPYDCFDIEDTQWYGSSNLTSGSLPISGKFEFNSNKYSSGRDSVLQSAVEYYWINSNAVAIVVNSNIPTHIKWNTTRPGQMCLVSNFTVPFYDHEEHRLPYLNYTICNGHDILQTHLYMRNYHSDPETLRLIDSNVLRYPHWSTVAEKRSRDINQEDVESVARTVIKHGLNCNTIQIDGMWQSSIGDFVFNSDTFPNITHMIETVKSANCRLSIEVNPYFHFSSANYNDGVRYGFFVKDSGDSVPGLVHWQHGIASVLDVSNSKARAWYMEKLFSLTSNFGIRSVRFSYGNTDWLPHRPHFSVVRENPNTLRHLFTNMVSKVTPELILDSTSQSQHIGGILSVKASIIINGTKACISDIVSKSLTLGILGYPFIMSDGFRSYQDENKLIPAMLPSKDLFIRWMELSAFFPAMSYSLSPWSYDLDTVRVSRNTSRLHESLVMPIISSPKMKQELLQGLSILRPLWMSDSTDVVAKSVRDQFLVGDKLLVAPVFCEGTFERDIYIPRGIWSDQLRSTLVVGPKWLSKYHTGLYEIPHFVFMRVYD